MELLYMTRAVSPARVARQGRFDSNEIKHLHYANGAHTRMICMWTYAYSYAYTFAHTYTTGRAGRRGLPELNPEPETPIPKPETPNPKPQTINPKP